MSDRTFTLPSSPSTSTVDLLEIPGMRVWWVQEFVDERRLLIDAAPTVEPCLECGQRAESKGRATVQVRDLPMAGKATRLVWVKRIWRCHDCNRSWRETHPEIAPRAVLTDRARTEAGRQVGEDGTAVAVVARTFGVSWDTVMRATTDQARDRFAIDGIFTVQTRPCLALGVDEKVMNRASRGRRREFVTVLVDLARGVADAAGPGDQPFGGAVAGDDLVDGGVGPATVRADAGRRDPWSGLDRCCTLLVVGQPHGSSPGRDGQVTARWSAVGRHRDRAARG